MKEMGGPKESENMVLICPGEFATNKRKILKSFAKFHGFFFVNLISDLPVPLLLYG